MATEMKYICARRPAPNPRAAAIRRAAAWAAAAVAAAFALACGSKPDLTLEAGSGGARAVAFTADSARLIVGGANGKVGLWRTETWEEERELESGPGAASAVVVVGPGRGRAVVVAGEGPVARMWDALADAPPIAALGEAHGPVSAIAAFGAPGAERIAMGGFTDTARVYDAATGALARELDGGTMALAASPDGKRFVTTLLGSARVWNAESLEPIGALEADAEDAALCAAYAAGGRALYVGHQSGTLRAWELDANGLAAGAGRELYRSKKPIQAVAALPDGRVAFGGADNLVRLIRPESGSVDRTMKCGAAALAIAVSPNGAWLAVAAEGRPGLVWPLGGAKAEAPKTPAPVAASGPAEIAAAAPQAPGPAAPNPESVAPTAPALRPAAAPAIGADKVGAPPGPDAPKDVAPKNAASKDAASEDVAPAAPVSEGAPPAPAPELAAPSASPAPAPGAEIPAPAATPTGPVPRELGDGGAGAAVRRVAFSADGALAFTAAADVITVWNAETGEKVRELKGHQGAVTALAVAPVGGRLLTAGEDHAMRVWEIETGRELARVPAGAGHGISSVALSRDGGRAVSGGSEGAVRLWDVNTAKSLRAINGHKDVVAGVEFSPDGRRIISASLDGTVRLWFAFNGSEVRAFNVAGADSPVWAAAFSPDGRRALTAGGDKVVRLWDVEGGSEIARLEGHSRLVRSVALSFNGKRAISGGAESAARVWDLASRAEIAQLDCGGGLMSVALSGDGKRALTGGMDGRAILWTLAP